MEHEQRNARSSAQSLAAPNPLASARRVFGAVLCAAAAAALLALGASAPCAYAQPNGNWEAPQQEMAVDGKVVTLGSHKSATSFAELLGLNGTVITTSQVDPQTLDDAQASDRLGVYGTAANQNPNPYLHNEFYNYYAAANKLPLSTEVVAKDTLSKAFSEASFNATVEEAYGTPADLALRPDIVLGIGGAPAGTVKERNMNHDTTDAVNYATWGAGLESPSQTYQYVLGIRIWVPVGSPLAGTKNSDNNLYEESVFYREGDETYDPIGVSYRATSQAGSSMSVTDGYSPRVLDAIATAKAAKKVMKQKGKVTRYGDPLEIALDYERYVKATKWFVLSQIAAKNLEKKKVAVVGDVVEADAAAGEELKDSKFRLLKLDPNGADLKLGNHAAAWAVEDTVDDLAADVAPEASAGMMQQKSAISADKLVEADVVICLPNYTTSMNADKAQVREVLEAAGYTEGDAAWPLIVDSAVPNGTYESNLDFNKSVEAALLVGFYQGNLYPDQVDAIDWLVYYASKFLHLKDEAIGTYLAAELSGSTLPGAGIAGLPLSSDDVQQAIARVDAKLSEGVAYYYKHKRATDDARPNIASSAAFDYHSGYDTGSVTITVPEGATLTVTDSDGAEILPDDAGAYKVGSDPLTATVKLDGYFDYVTQVRRIQSSLAVSLADMAKKRSFSVHVPEGAEFVVQNGSGKRVFPSKGAFTVGAEETATVIVNLAGYRQYTAQVPPDMSELNVEVSDFRRLPTSTAISVPAGASFEILDANGEAVPANADETYDLVNEDTYTLKVTLEGYLPYSLDVVGGESSKITVYRKDMQAMVDVFDCEATLEPESYKYTGKPCEPKVTVKNGDTTLEQGKDYKVTYKDNVNAGTASVVIDAIEGNDNFKGTLTKTFKIAKASQKGTMTVKAKSKSVTVQYKKLKKKAQVLVGPITVKKAKGKVTYKKVAANKKATKFKVYAKNGRIALAKRLGKGTYKIKVKVKAAGNDNYLSYSKDVIVTVKVK